MYFIEYIVTMNDGDTHHGFVKSKSKKPKFVQPKIVLDIWKTKQRAATELPKVIGLNTIITRI